VAHNYVTTVAAPGAVRHAIDRAFRIALSEKCVTCVIVPKDLQEEKAVEAEPHEHNTIHSSAGWSQPRVVPRDDDLKRAAEFLPEEGQARGVQIDLKGRMLGIRYPMEVNLQGDSAETLRALLPYLKRKKDRGWRQKIDGEMREWREILDARAQVDAKPLNPA